MTVHWGIVGAGKIAESQFAPAVAAADGHELGGGFAAGAGCGAGVLRKGTGRGGRMTVWRRCWRMMK